MIRSRYKLGEKVIFLDSIGKGPSPLHYITGIACFTTEKGKTVGYNIEDGWKDDFRYTRGHICLVEEARKVASILGLDLEIVE